MTALRYGILSTSSIAPRFIAALREAGAGEIVAVSSRTIEKARQKASQWNIPVAYGSHEELLADKQVNIVYISAVNSQHYSLAKLALLAGKHVICEKPCTTSSEDTLQLFALARDKGLFLMEAQKMLFLPTITEVKRRISAGDLGKVFMVEMSQSFSPGYNVWQFDKSLGGGTLLSSGIYGVELLLWLFGDIKEIAGACSVVEGGAEDQYVLSGKMEKDILFSIKNSTRITLDNTARIYGTDGYIEIPEYWKARRAIIYRNGEEPLQIAYPCEFELKYEAIHIAECISKGLLTSPVVTEALTVSGILSLEKVLRHWEV
ncbi:MAG: Gfo/Idh/MocA family oxidoreductase [Ruminococcaceae bacterium]|nr:Gfo/Idh/MocA family oxidoreductase [Oscillospiraceae bacterium]